MRILMNKLMNKFYELAVTNGMQKKSGFWTGVKGQELKKEILQNKQLNEFKTFQEKRWALFNKTLIRPRCYCGNLTPFVRTNYQETCSIKCASNLQKNRNKFKQTCLERYGVENPMKCETTKNKIKQTCLERYGVENPRQSEEIKRKSVETCRDRYGVDYTVQAEAIKEKIKQTNIERYGVDFIFQSEAIKEKIKQTNIERYGVENPQQNKKIRQKSKDKQIELYGKDGWNPQKVENTNMKKYGVKTPFQAEEIKEKIKQTNIERYGVEYPMQSSIVFQKSQKYKQKDFIFKNGKAVKVIGYEPLALKILEEIFDIDDIIVNPKFTISYQTKKYHPDIYIKSKNLLIEVKSEYTFKKDYEKNMKKREASISQGFSFEFWVFDKNLVLSIS
jgi:hypothetical protein